MKTRIIPIFVPHRGCPHDCIFCNQKKITGVGTDITEEEVKNIIESYLKTIDKNCHIEIAFFGGSFTAIDIEIQKNLLSIAKEYVDKGLVKDIRLSTRPDCINKNILNILKENKVTIIELGVQSMDLKVLDNSIRGHSDLDVVKSSKLIKEYGFKLGLQMMAGLPSDTEEKCIYTAKRFIDLKPDFVRIYPTLVVKDTGLEKLYNEKKYNPFNLEETIQIVKKLLVLFYLNSIKVIRVGLQATEDIALGRDVICGPYHPSLRELIESRIYRDYIEILIKDKNIKEKIIIYVNKKNISKIVGNKKANIEYLREKYKINLKIQERILNLDEIYFNYNNNEYKTNIKEIYNKLYNIYKF
ncbi:elongator complex protein 3 [Tepidibacter formicigenes]|jgi:histone acetyltransferase (RNA polymerase elongator complex component)|uniref:Radical SAM superfamily protein n=1 Tax=Tepidibacter formicigenes DSM 15518 TaxID=1123349 RepID=A0A1M6PWH1_9FIRM|nr:radical SAM protein [Tepidibacter formicigenes]SHK12270.1 Radical SAM superfamily protein [Tepidibacter formicigenes DSM 15518]